MARLSDKTAIITGGAGGIGLAAARLFAQEGAKILLVDRDEHVLQQAISTMATNSVSYAVADVTQAEQVQNYVDVAMQRYGGIDVLLNNAGIEGEVRAIPNYSLDVFDKVMAVNVRGVFLGLKYVIPVMRDQKGGSIVITSSIMGVGGGPFASAYVASKHAVVGLMRSAAAECAPFGVRVNTVNPGYTATRMMDSLQELAAPGDGESIKQQLEQEVPLHRYAAPDDIARMMLFLASDESSYCTGGVYMVDGGITKRC